MSIFINKDEENLSHAPTYSKNADLEGVENATLVPTKPAQKVKKRERDFRLFELNDVAKYGLFYASGDVLKPVAQKAFLYLVWKCNHETPGKFESVSVSVTELCAALGYEKGVDSNYCRKVKNVENNLYEIMSKPIIVHDEQKKEKVSFLWVRKARICEKTGMVEVEFDEDFNRFFGSSLKRDFTVVKLKYLNRLNSSSAITLYAYFCSIKNFYCSTISVHDLVKLVTNKEEAEYKHFKGNILTPALEAINSLTDIHVKMQESKDGRLVRSIIFTVAQDAADDEMDLFAKYNNLKPDEAVTFPYSENWKQDYEYNMAKQRYVRRIHRNPLK